MSTRRGLLVTALFLGLGLASHSPGGPNTSAPAAPAAAEWANDLTPIGPAHWIYERAAHLLERAGFGGTPDEIHKLAAMTPKQAVDYLVDYEAIDDSKLPPFEPSGIYPHGHRLAPLQQLLPGLRTSGKALGVETKKTGDLPDQPVVDEFYTLLISEHWEMRRAGWWWSTAQWPCRPQPIQALVP